jgi:hypothetical protein
VVLRQEGVVLGGAQGLGGQGGVLGLLQVGGAGDGRGVGAPAALPGVVLGGLERETAHELAVHGESLTGGSVQIRSSWQRLERTTTCDLAVNGGMVKYETCQHKVSNPGPGNKITRVQIPSSSKPAEFEAEPSVYLQEA